MKEDDHIEDFSIYDPLREDLRLTDKDLEKLFKDDDEPFVARHIRTMLKKRGTVEEITTSDDCALAR